MSDMVVAMAMATVHRAVNIGAIGGYPIWHDRGSRGV